MMQANKLRLGIFFVVTMTFFLAVIIWLTGGLSGKKTVPYVSYFDWSVSGLSPGGEVMYNGVLVGTVRSISIAPDGRLVQVLMEVDPLFVVDSEITACLTATGITGSQKIDLSRAGEGDTQLNRAGDLGFTPPASVIPVTPGMMQKLTHGADRLVEIMDIMDFEVLNEELTRMLVNVNRLMDAAEVEVLMECLVSNSRNIDSLLITYNRLGRNADLLVTQMRSEFPGLSSDTKHLIENLEELTEVVKVFALNANAALEPVSGFAGEARELVPLIREGLARMVLPQGREVVW
jgi:phospholipid/cholesterol/gamma-HCH transport system substrate-binding protein